MNRMENAGVIREKVSTKRSRRVATGYLNR